MKIARQGVDKDAMRKHHHVNPVGKRLKCWKCGLLADSTEDDFKGWFPRLSVQTYWYESDQSWWTRIGGRCPNCGSGDFYALCSGDH